METKGRRGLSMEQLDLLQTLNRAERKPFIGGQGALLTDADGNEWLDFNEICVVLGQKNAAFSARMTAALSGVTSGKAGMSQEKETLYQYLTASTDGQYRQIHLTASGSEATEWAVRTALKITGKTEVLSFWNSVHGRTMLSASMSGLPKRKTGYGPLTPGIVFGAYPDCAHCPYEKAPDHCAFFCLRHLEEKLRFESANDVGAVILEPIQGAGVIVPPAGWLKALQAWTHRIGALLILDEIQTGMGRTGSLYRFQKEGLDPDMLLLGKGIGNGLHLAALLTKEVPEEHFLPALAGGTGDGVLACTAGCVVFEELLEHGLIAHIQELGDCLRDGLESLQRNHPCMRRIRGAGLALAIELSDENTYRQLLEQLRAQRIFVGVAAYCTVMLKPPYTVTHEQVDHLLLRMDAALTAAEKRTNCTDLR